MILPGLVSVFFGYTNPTSSRRYLAYYCALSIAIIMMWSFFSCEDDLFSGFFDFVLPGLMTLSLTKFFHSGALNVVAWSVILVIVLEIPLMFFFYTFGRWFSNKTGNLHQF